MERVVFADSWRTYFSEVGLESFDDFYDYAGGTKIEENNKRNVCRLTFGQGPETRAFYIKRFQYPHFKDLLTAWRNFGRLTSQAGAEWRNADLLIKNGIDAYKPVCMGEQTTCGIERKSFMITEQLKPTCMVDFVMDKWRTLERSEQEKTIVAMAKLVRRVHEANFSLPDLYIWHVFIDEESLGNSPHLTIIDLHRMLRNVRSPDKKLMDLGKLYWSMSGDYFDDAQKDLLITTYISDGWTGAKNGVVNKVRKRAGKINGRRKLWVYYDRLRA